MIPMILFFWGITSFSYHNFQIHSIKFLANCKILLPFKCTPLLFRWLLFVFTFSIMLICILQRCDRISPIFIGGSFESVLMSGWDITACVVGNCSTINDFNRFLIIDNIICSNMQYHMVGFFFKNGYQVVIPIRACRYWEWPYFNQTFPRHFAFINTSNHGVSNDNACFFWPAVFHSIFIFFVGFLLLCYQFFGRNIFIFITVIRFTLRICVFIKNFFYNIIEDNSWRVERLKSPLKAEAYLEPKRASTMEIFCECT